MALKPGAKVEVAGEASEGFADCWYTAVVVKVTATKTILVQYDNLLDDNAKNPLKELAAQERVRPAAPDDSKTVPLSSRQVGEAVDFWHEEGWWSGHVHETWDDEITVFFPNAAENEKVLCAKALKLGEEYTQDTPRVRTQMRWLHGASSWDHRKVEPRAFEGSHNHRSKAQKAAAKQPAKSSQAVSTQKPPAAKKADSRQGDAARADAATAARPERDSSLSAASQQSKGSAGAKRKELASSVEAVDFPAPKRQAPPAARPAVSKSARAGPATSAQQTQKPAAAAARPSSASQQAGATQKPAQRLASAGSGQAVSRPASRGSNRPGSRPASQCRQPDAVLAHRPAQPSSPRATKPSPAAQPAAKSTAAAPSVSGQPQPGSAAAKVAAQQQLCPDTAQQPAAKAHARQAQPCPQQQPATQASNRPSASNKPAELGSKASCAAAAHPPPVPRFADSRAAGQQPRSPFAPPPAKSASLEADIARAKASRQPQRTPSQQQQQAAMPPPPPHVPKRRAVPPPFAHVPKASGAAASARPDGSRAPSSRAAADKAPSDPRRKVPSNQQRPSSQPADPRAAVLAKAAHPKRGDGAARVQQLGAAAAAAKAPKSASQQRAAGQTHTDPAKANKPYTIPKIQKRQIPEGLDISNGHLVCLDNTGGWTDRDALKKALYKAFPELREVRTADVALERDAGDAGVVRAGWLCLDFRSPVDAALAFPRLQRTYMRVEGCEGPPRPLIPHWPRWRSMPWGAHGKARMPGHLPLMPCSAHFVQSNSIEFDMALHWRLVSKRLAATKERMHNRQLDGLKQLLTRYRQAKKLPVPAAASPPRKKLRGAKMQHSHIWLKGISPETDVEMVTTAFEQFSENPQVDHVKSAVTGQPYGHMRIALKEPKKAEYVLKDLTECIFLMQGQPRPVEASIACPGPPRGSQRLYDEAAQSALGPAAVAGRGGGSRDSGTGGVAVDAVELLEIKPQMPQTAGAANAKRPLDEAVALRLRKLLSSHEFERAELQRQGMTMKQQLHQEHVDLYNSEKAKYETISRLNNTPIVRELLGKNHRQPYRNLQLASIT